MEHYCTWISVVPKEAAGVEDRTQLLLLKTRHGKVRQALEFAPFSSI